MPGGTANTASQLNATVGGGSYNIARGFNAVVPGGARNTALGNSSLAAGYRATANHPGTFVWADSSDLDFASTGNNQFFVRASGGVYFYVSPNGNAGPNCRLTDGTGLACSSDRELKEGFLPVDGREVLARLAEIPIQSWRLKDREDAVRHIGPVAQHFYAAFGVGKDDTHISTVDVEGVALAAIQELYRIVREKEDKIQALEMRLKALEKARNQSRDAEKEGPP
ncbi:MAG: tail fiber domain-containing protein [Thermoanaerobaculia bacterium]